ncbi:MAG: AbrB/MazE/SpoVT family DNA-binding domain-containing protein [Gammaproteobacteria bacterium]|nr:AbrB/MazE/SpoVT family DNA-binding domain-containing protein [Gammaproteobacteria bacterium]
MDSVDSPSLRDQFMALVKVRRAAQITLPREIRVVAHLEEGGYLDAQWTKEGILLRPVSIGTRESIPEQEAKSRGTADEAHKTSVAKRRR